MSSFFHRKKGSSPHRSASPKSARKGSTSPSNSRHTPQRGGGGGGEGGGTTSSGDVLTNIVAARQGSGSSNPDGTDVWGYLYAEKNRKGNKKKDSSLIVEYDQEDDMIVRLEGFMMKKGEGLVASFKKRWFVFDIRTDSEKLYYYDSREQKRCFGDVCLKSVYEIRRTGNHNEFEMLTEARIYVFQADSHRDMMKWINQLSLFFGVQDLPSDDSDDNSYEFNLLQGQLQIQDQLPPLSEGEGEGKDNELNHFLTLPLSSRDRLLLRDVQTSAKGLLAHPRFTLFSNLGDDRNNSRNNGGLEHPYIRLSVELRDQNNDDKPIQIKCAQFDRVIGHGGLLFYVEILDKSAQDQMEGQQSAFKTLLCPGVWLLLRLCQKKKGKIVYMDAPSRDSLLFGVHDLHCKKCRLSRACDHPCKSVKGKRGAGGAASPAVAAQGNQGSQGGAAEADGAEAKKEEGLGTSLELNVLLQFVSEEHEKVMKEKKKREEEQKEKEVGGEGEEEEEEEEFTAYLHATVLGMKDAGSISKGFIVGAVDEKKKGRAGGTISRRKPALAPISSVAALNPNSPIKRPAKKRAPQQFNNRYPYNDYGTDWLRAFLSLRESDRGDLPCFALEYPSLSLTSSLSQAAISGLGEKPLLLVYFTLDDNGHRAGELLGGLIDSCRELFKLPLHVVHCQISLGEEVTEGTNEGEEDALLDNCVTCSLICPDTYEVLQTSSSLKGALRFLHSFQPSVLLSAFGFSSLSPSVRTKETNKIITLLTGFLCQVDACSFVYVANFSPIDCLNDSLATAFSFRQNPSQQHQQEQHEKSYIFYAGLMGYLEGVLSNTRKSKPFQIVNLNYFEELGASLSSSPSSTVSSAVPSPMSTSYSTPSFAALATSPKRVASASVERDIPHVAQQPLASSLSNPSSRSGGSTSMPHFSSSPVPAPLSPAPSSSYPSLTPPAIKRNPTTTSPCVPPPPLPPALPSPPSPLVGKDVLSFFEGALVERDKEESSKKSDPTLYFLNEILGKVISNRDKYLSISSSSTHWFSSRYVPPSPTPTSPTFTSSVPPPSSFSLPSATSTIGVKNLRSVLLPSNEDHIANIEILEKSKTIDISFSLSQTIQELKDKVKDTIALDRPVSEYRLAMKEPFQLLRDQDCAGAYIDLVTKGFPLSLYLSYAKDTLFCPLAPKKKFLVSEIANHIPSREERVVQVQSISAPEQFSLSLPTSNSVNEATAHSVSYLKSLGTPSSCVVFEGLYGVGFRLVKCLVSLGVGKIIIFSRFALTNKVEERLRELKSVANGVIIIHIQVKEEEDFGGTLDKYNSILTDIESVYFVDEDVFNFSLSKFSVKHTNTLLHLKTNFAQILHEWSVKREVSLSQFVVVSVFGADYNGSHTTPHSNSHYFYRHMVMRRVLSGLPSLWLRISSSFLQDLNQAFAYIFGRHHWHKKGAAEGGGRFFSPIVANTWETLEEPPAPATRKGSWTNSQKTTKNRVGSGGGVVKSRQSRTGSVESETGRGARVPVNRGPLMTFAISSQKDLNLPEKRSTQLMAAAAETCTPEKVGLLIMTIKDCLRKYATKKEEVDSYSFDRFLNLNILQTSMIESNWQELKDKLSVLFLISITVKEIMSQIVIGDIALLVIQKIRLKQGERENTLDAATKPASEINQALKMEIARLTVDFLNPYLPCSPLSLKKLQSVAKTKLLSLSFPVASSSPRNASSSPPPPPPRGPVLSCTDLMEVKEELSSSLSLLIPGGKTFIENSTFEQFINSVLRQGISGAAKKAAPAHPPIPRHVSMMDIGSAAGNSPTRSLSPPKRGTKKGASPRGFGLGSEARLGRIERDRS